MEILFAIQEDYSQHLAVAMSSIIQKCPDQDINFHVVVDDISQKHSDWLRKNIKRSSSTIQFYFAPQLNNIPIDGHASEANYYRLFATNILPVSLDKVLYLDADLVVHDNLDALWAIDISSYAVAAVHHANNERSMALNIAPDEYFNSGVMVINLEMWRTSNYLEQFLGFINDRPHLIKYWDQDVLNSCLNGNIFYLSKEWNSAEYYPSVKILHFMGKHKPWSHHYEWNKTKDIYFKYLMSTPFKFRYWKSILHHIIRQIGF